MTKTDSMIVRAAQNGSREAFDELFEQHKLQIFNYILRMMGSVDDAHDLTQDTFLKAFVALPKARGEMNFTPWLYRIATNVCRDEQRRRRIVNWQPLEVLSSVFVPEVVATDDPEREFVLKERAAQVQGALARLKPSYRQCLLLREGQDLSCEEIGQVMGVSRQAAKSLLFRAREQFRKVYLALEPGGERRGVSGRWRLGQSWQA